MLTASIAPLVSPEDVNILSLTEGVRRRHPGRNAVRFLITMAGKQLFEFRGSIYRMRPRGEPIERCGRL